MACTDENPPVQIQIGMVSLGCPKNLADSEAMLGLLKSHGYGITPDADLADLIIVNTCGFIDSAKKESIGAILDMAEKKAAGKCRALIVAGCLSERFRDTFFNELPEVDAAIGVGEYGRICEIADALAVRTGLAGKRIPDAGCSDTACSGLEKRIRAVRDCTAVERLGHLNSKRVLTNGSGYVYIKIAEGCDNRCSYCVIPAIRGSYAGRSRADILAEAERLSAGRDIEAVLVAQDTTKYGAEGGLSGSSGICGLIESLSRIEGVKWIRLMYAYPDRVDGQLAGLFASNRKLVRYLDMPVQHAARGVLKNMGRRYGKSDVYGVVGLLRDAAPDIVLRTTLMTGFPGESEADFLELLDFIETVKFDRLGVFAYSREDGTPAASMDGRIPKRVAETRRAEVIRRQNALTAKSDSARIGREYEAIIDAGPYAMKNGDIYYNVRTYAEAPQIDGVIRARVNGSPGGGVAAVTPGFFRMIRVTGKDSKGLFGELLP